MTCGKLLLASHWQRLESSLSPAKNAKRIESWLDESLTRPNTSRQQQEGSEGGREEYAQLDEQHEGGLPDFFCRIKFTVRWATMCIKWQKEELIKSCAERKVYNANVSLNCADLAHNFSLKQKIYKNRGDSRLRSGSDHPKPYPYQPLESPATNFFYKLILGEDKLRVPLSTPRICLAHV
jgi:hypothetical protein